MKAKRHYRAISVSATMLDGTGGHVRLGPRSLLAVVIDNVEILLLE
jgi:hypothetical protein